MLKLEANYNSKEKEITEIINLLSEKNFYRLLWFAQGLLLNKDQNNHNNAINTSGR